MKKRLFNKLQLFGYDEGSAVNSFVDILRENGEMVGDMSDETIAILAVASKLVDLERITELLERIADTTDQLNLCIQRGNGRNRIIFGGEVSADVYSGE